MVDEATQAAWRLADDRRRASVGVEGHFADKRPWARIDECVTGYMAEIVGARSVDEVAVMNSLSVNLHLLLMAFFRPTSTR